jgi:integrase
MTLGEWSRIFLAHRQVMVGEGRLSPATLAANTSHMRALIRFWGEKFHIARLDGEQIDRYKAEHQNGNGTSHARLTALSAALNLAVARRIIPYNPIQAEGHLAVTTAPKEVRCHTHEDVLRLLDAWPPEYPRERLAVALAGLSGLRIEECRGLRPSDGSRKGRYLYIREVLVRQLGGGWVAKPPKNGLPRKVPVCQRLFEEIDRARPTLGKGRLLEPTSRFDGGANTTLSVQLQKAQERLGLERLTFHGLRKSAANWWRECGVPGPSVSTWLGHPGDVPLVTRRHYLTDGPPAPRPEEAHLLEEWRPET